MEPIVQRQLASATRRKGTGKVPSPWPRVEERVARRYPPVSRGSWNAPWWSAGDSRCWFNARTTGRLWHPAGVRDVRGTGSGGVAALNPRLMAGSPPGWPGAPARRSNDPTLSARTAPKDLVTEVSWRSGAAITGEPPPVASTKHPNIFHSGSSGRDSRSPKDGTDNLNCELVDAHPCSLEEASGG